MKHVIHASAEFILYVAVAIAFALFSSAMREMRLSRSWEQSVGYEKTVSNLCDAVVLAAIAYVLARVT